MFKLRVFLAGTPVNRQASRVGRYCLAQAVSWRAKAGSHPAGEACFPWQDHGEGRS